VAATLLNESLHLSSNVHIALDHFQNSFRIFQILQRILPAKKNEATQFHCNYQIQQTSQTEKMFKHINKCTFRNRTDGYAQYRCGKEHKWCST